MSKEDYTKEAEQEKYDMNNYRRTVDDQEARLVLPSADQSEEMHNQAGLIVKFPEAIKIGGSEYYNLNNNYNNAYQRVCGLGDFA